MLEGMKWARTKAVLTCFLSSAALCPMNPAWSQTRQFQFEQFSVNVYQGRIHIPKWLHKENDGEWSYSNWKPALPPSVTFAGEYDLAGISCGTECRYYELTNLRTGADVPGISMFDGGEELPVTGDGHPYLTILYYKPESRLLIAEYHLDFRDPDRSNACRQRYFVLENGKLRPVSKTFQFCTEGDEQ
jgi:hypothetical protein